MAVRDHFEAFSGVDVVVVTFTSQQQLRQYSERLNVPFPLLTDPDRSVYQAFGLERGRLRDLFRPATLKLYARLLKAGRKLERSNEDVRQLGGDFLFGPDGKLAWFHRAISPDDRPAIETIVQQIGAL
jgi:AhpC/TSA antioxidant enzyme